MVNPIVESIKDMVSNGQNVHTASNEVRIELDSYPGHIKHELLRASLAKAHGIQKQDVKEKKRWKAKDDPGMLQLTLPNQTELKDRLTLAALNAMLDDASKAWIKDGNGFLKFPDTNNDFGLLFIANLLGGQPKKGQSTVVTAAYRHNGKTFKQSEHPNALTTGSAPYAVAYREGDRGLWVSADVREKMGKALGISFDGATRSPVAKSDSGE